MGPIMITNESASAILGAVQTGNFATFPEVEIPLTHTFAPGLYIRTAIVPAGTYVVGRQHLTEHLFVITKGDMTLITSQGNGQVQARYKALFPVGSIQAGFAHTDVVWSTVHVTDETDIAKLEEALILPFSPRSDFAPPSLLQ